MFEMRPHEASTEHYQKIMHLFKACPKLKKLQITANLKLEIVEVLNKFIQKDANLRTLIVNFANYQNSQPESQSYELKFHKYLKNLRHLSLKNIAYKHFSESMFDMACIKKLKELSLGFIPDLSLPNFSEALSKFAGLYVLSIS